MGFPLYIAKRYLLSKNSKNAINIITLITISAVIIGTIALFIVLSVFSGLKEFSSSFIRVSDPDLKITSVKGKSFFITDSVSNALKNDKIVSYTKVVEEKAFFTYKNKPKIANIKGVDANYLNVNSIDTAVYNGDWIDKELLNSVVVGNGIANDLSLFNYDVLEPLEVYAPKPGEGYVNNPKTAFNRFKLLPVGVFRLTDELDNKYVFSHLQVAQGLLGYSNNQITALELKLKSNADKASVIKNLQTNLGANYKVQTREQLNAVFYKMLNSENLISYSITTLIVIIALFNVSGAIIMVIIDKKENIKTLFSLGATIREIKKIFILQGFLLSFFGLLIGLAIAIILVLLQKKFGFLMITNMLAYPVEFKISNVLIVFVTITILGGLASLIASIRITKKFFEA